MYNYTYEAHAIFSDMSLHLDELYVSKALSITVIAAIIAFVMVFFAAIAIKKARPLGIVTAILQPVGLYAAMQYVLKYAEIDFSGMDITVTSSISTDDAISKLQQKLTEVLARDIIPAYLQVIPFVFLMLAVFVVTMIYIINLRKAPGKGLAVTALILLILKYLLISPVEIVSLWMGQGSSEIQSVWWVVFVVAWMIPLLLVCIQGITALGSGRKEATADSVPETVQEQPQE